MLVAINAIGQAVKKLFKRQADLKLTEEFTR